MLLSRYIRIGMTYHISGRLDCCSCLPLATASASRFWGQEVGEVLPWGGIAAQLLPSAGLPQFAQFTQSSKFREAGLVCPGRICILCTCVFGLSVLPTQLNCRHGRNFGFQNLNVCVFWHSDFNPPCQSNECPKTQMVQNDSLWIFGFARHNFGHSASANPDWTVSDLISDPFHSGVVYFITSLWSLSSSLSPCLKNFYRLFAGGPLIVSTLNLTLMASTLLCSAHTGLLNDNDFKVAEAKWLKGQCGSHSYTNFDP